MQRGIEKFDPTKVIDFRLTPTGGFVRRLPEQLPNKVGRFVYRFTLEKLNKIKKAKRQLAQNWGVLPL